MPNVKKMQQKKDIFGLDRVIRVCPNSAARRGALRALGGICDPRSVAPILYAHADADESVRLAAAQALDRCGPEAVPNLCMSFSYTYPDQRPKLAAVRALERLWEDGGLVQLEFLAQSCSRKQDEDLFLAAVGSLKRIAHPATVRNILGPPDHFKKLKPAEAETRLRAAVLLEDSHTPALLAGLLGQLPESSSCVRMIEKLGEIGSPCAQKTLALITQETENFPEYVKNALRAAMEKPATANNI